MKHAFFPCVLIAACLFALSTANGATDSAAEAITQAAPRSIFLGELSPVSAIQDWSELQIDTSMEGKPLSIGSRKFANGLGTHANSRVVYDLGGRCTQFDAWAVENPDLANEWHIALRGALPEGWESALPTFSPKDDLATRPGATVT